MIKLYKYFCLLIILTGTSFLINAQQLKIYSKVPNSCEYLPQTNYTANDSIQLFRKLESVLQDDLINGYALAGYDSIVFKTENIAAYYNKGEKYIWDNLNFKIPDLPDKMSNGFTGRKKAFNQLKLKTFTNKLLNYYADRGYPFASIKLDSVIFKDNFVSANLEINKGAHYTFDSLIIKGDPKIKSYYIRKIVGIQREDFFSFSIVTKIDKEIKSIPFIEQSRPYQLAFSDSIVDILLYLRNRKASRFSGLIGILPNNKTTGKLLITGDVDLYLLNSIGIGELFVFKWQKYESLSQNLKTEVSVPYLFKSDFGVGAKLDLEKKDTSYLNTDFTGKIIFGSNTSKGFELFYRRKSSFLIGERAAFINSNYMDYSVNLYGINYMLISTDNIFNPRKGVFLKLSAGLGSKIILAEEEDISKSAFQTHNSLDVSWFLPLTDFLTVKLRNYTSSIYSKSLSDNELDLIGGLNTLRGFDELSLRASSFSIFNFELRYIFEERSALFAFVDGGYFEKRNTASDYYNYALGVGIGLDLNTPAGVFSLVYAVGKLNNDAFIFNNSKIHFGYRNSF